MHGESTIAFMILSLVVQIYLQKYYMKGIHEKSQVYSSRFSLLKLNFPSNFPSIVGISSTLILVKWSQSNYFDQSFDLIDLYLMYKCLNQFIQFHACCCVTFSHLNFNEAVLVLKNKVQLQPTLVILHL